MFTTSEPTAGTFRVSLIQFKHFFEDMMIFEFPIIYFHIESNFAKMRSDVTNLSVASWDQKAPNA